MRDWPDPRFPYEDEGRLRIEAAVIGAILLACFVGALAFIVG